jgi:glycosyltransferase involved in cell wall biosynthesis
MSKLHYSLMISAIGDSQICRQIYLSVSSYADKQPSVQLTQTARDGIIRFVALNINQVVKGSEILLREFQSLHEDKKNTELHLFGDTEDTHLPGVVRHGPYKSSELDAILSPMDVGIVPSIWPESYAYVGPEMLTRGIPLIVSTAGAMREYVIPNVNGLHFDPAVPGQLKAAMASLASDSELLKKLKFNAPKSEHGIKRFADHINEMEAIYVEVDSLPNASSLSCA